MASIWFVFIFLLFMRTTIMEIYVLLVNVQWQHSRSINHFLHMCSPCQGGWVWLVASGDSCRLPLIGGQLWLWSLDSCWATIHSGAEVHDGLIYECYKEYSLRGCVRNLPVCRFTEVVLPPTSVFWDLAVFTKVFVAYWRFVVMKETPGYLCPLKTMLDRPWNG